MNNMGNNLIIIQNDIRDLIKRIDKMQEQIDDIQKKVDIYNIINSIVNFATGIAGIAFNGFGIGLVQDINDVVSATAATINNINALAFGESSDTTHEKGVLDAVININDVDNLPKFTNTSVLSSNATDLLIKSITDKIKTEITNYVDATFVKK